MRTYYFDTQDGVPVRDNKGIDFRRASEAIEHSKKLASDIRDEANKRDRDLTIVVTDGPAHYQRACDPSRPALHYMRNRRGMSRADIFD